MVWLLLFLFGGIGVLFRFVLGTHLNSESFPYGILLANVLGSLLIGYLYMSPLLNQSIRVAVLVGFLGALTTFSSFSLETVSMIERGRLSLALVYLLGTNALALSACWLGMKVGQS